MLANSYSVIKCGFLSAIMIINLRTAFSQDHSNEKKSFLIFLRGRNDENVVQISDLSSDW